MPHGLAFDSKERLYVADRGNNRIQVFDQDGKYLSEMKQFSRPAGIFIDQNDTIFVADSDSPPQNHSHEGWRRGIRIGSLKDGKVVAYIPDPAENPTGTHAAEGVAVDAKGNVYGAEVGNMALKRYERK
jgi:DNA-binding beta-propeller fold protein YncE